MTSGPPDELREDPNEVLGALVTRRVSLPSHERFFVVEADVYGINFTDIPEFHLGGVYFYRKLRLSRPVGSANPSHKPRLYRANLALAGARWEEAIASVQGSMFERLETLLSFCERHHVAFRNIHLYGQRFDFLLEHEFHEGPHESLSPRVRPNRTTEFVETSVAKLKTWTEWERTLFLASIDWICEPTVAPSPAMESRFFSLWASFEYIAALFEPVRSTGLISDSDWQTFLREANSTLSSGRMSEASRQLIRGRLHQLRAPTVSERLMALNSASGFPLNAEAVDEIAAYRNGLQHEPWNFTTAPSRVLRNLDRLLESAVMAKMDLSPSEFLADQSTEALGFQPHFSF